MSFSFPQVQGQRVHLHKLVVKEITREALPAQHNLHIFWENHMLSVGLPLRGISAASMTVSGSSQRFQWCQQMVGFGFKVLHSWGILHALVCFARLLETPEQVPQVPGIPQGNDSGCLFTSWNPAGESGTGPSEGWLWVTGQVIWGTKGPEGARRDGQGLPSTHRWLFAGINVLGTELSRSKLLECSWRPLALLHQDKILFKDC